jgi:hypothetical protein
MSAASRAGDADFGTVKDAHEQVAAPTAWSGQTFAGNAKNFSARNTVLDLHSQRCAGNTPDRFHAALSRAFWTDFQITTQIGTAHFKTEVGQSLDAKLYEAAVKGSGAWQPEPSAGRGIGRNDQFINLRTIRVGGVVDTHFARRAPEKILQPQVHVPGNIALGFGGARFTGGFSRRVEFTVMGAPAFRVAQDFMRGIELLCAGDGRGRIRIQVGMVLAGESAVGGADLRGGAMTVKAERGVMIGNGCRQRTKLIARRVPAPAWETTA